jgi:DNA-binding IclR family transcriptional regulator
MPVTARGKGTVGVVVISGPSVRLSDQRLRELVPLTTQAAEELAQACVVSPWFDRAWRPREPAPNGT